MANKAKIQCAIRRSTAESMRSLRCTQDWFHWGTLLRRCVTWLLVHVMPLTLNPLHVFQPELKITQRRTEDGTPFALLRYQ